MASSGASSSSTEFAVIVPKDAKKVFNVLRFAGSADVPNMLKTRKMLMRREDNSRTQSVQQLSLGDGKEVIPKTGAGSEFGREEREERARRLRGGRTLRKYNPDDQPWITTFIPQASTSKNEKPSLAGGLKPRRFKGLREAGATENASWFIFTQRPDKSFVALPINEWYGFAAMTQYDHLNSEEAEEEFQKRKKTLNFFTLMQQKRLQQKNQEGDAGDFDADIKPETSTRIGGKGRMHLTDLDAEWVEEEDDDADDLEGEEKIAPAEDASKIADVDFEFVLPNEGKKKSRKKAQEILRQKKRLRSKVGEDASDISDSDEGDFDGREMDYMTSSGAESELDDKDMPDDVKEEIEEAERAELGVEDEDGLRKLNDSAAEDEEDEETKDSKEDEMDVEDKESRSRQGFSSSDSDKDESGKDDDSDSDIERFELSSSGRQLPSSNQGKRRMPAEVITASGKRVKLELPSSAAEPASTSGSSSSAAPARSAIPASDIDAQLEQAIRHYLSRTPMSATQLVEKFVQKARSASASGGPAPPSSEDLAKRIAAIILRLKPEQIRSGNQVYFSLSPDKTG